MSPQNEDFLFSQEALRRGYVSEEQVEEGFLLQRRMHEELEIDERLGVILVKRGWLGEEQARRVHARIEPESGHDEIEGYRIQEKVGRGAMGTVYKAHHLGLQRTVAIKILRRDLARDQIQVERLKEEAKILASLDHPNIVRALDAGESRGFPFVVMEYVEGETLKERMARRGPLHEVDALRIARGIADALERARRMGVVHRDVKPGNIILTKKDEPKLMDLGLAKGPVDLGLTQHGATVGTPQYISPEQAQDPRRADVRSDIYSLGATLYAMVTGRPPFQGTTLAEVLTKVLYEAPVPPRVLNKKVSPEVGYLIERMMLKDPALRYRTPADVVHDIDEILAGRSIIPVGFTGNWEAFLLRQRIRKWTKIVAVATILTFLLGSGSFWYLRHLEFQQAQAEGEKAIAAALNETTPYATDSAVDIQEKLGTARALVERWTSYEPDGLEQLHRRMSDLEKQAAWFEDLTRLDRDLETLGDAGNYAKAVQRLEDLAERIGTGTPAARALETVKGGVLKDSRVAFSKLTTETFSEPARTLDELLEAQRIYRKKLEQGLFPEPDVLRAREEADLAIAAVTTILEDVAALERDFSAVALAPRLEDLRLAAIRRDFERERGSVVDRSRRAWSRLEDRSWPASWTGEVRPLVQARLEKIERQVDALMTKRGSDVLEEVRDLRAQPTRARQLLHQLARAALHANLSQLRADAERELDRLRAELELEQRKAAVALEAIESDVRRFLRGGDTKALRTRVREALDGMPEHWPFRKAVEDLFTLADAYEGLCNSAFDGLLNLDRVEMVRMRDETVERRWIVRASDRGALKVSVSTTASGDSRERSLFEVHPEQLAEWATPEGRPLAPLPRAAALLAALPETEPVDLRPRLRLLRGIEKAFEEAQYTGGLLTWVQERFTRFERQQDEREVNARGAFNAAQTFALKGAWENSLWYLSQLRAPDRLQKTNAYVTLREQIDVLWDRVSKEVANLKLAKRFPGAKLGLDGEVTWVLFDWESAIQLESFRRGGARATGIREPYVSDGVVTPSGQNHRLHLLKGMEGLIRDRPFSLPCIFDPAERISIEFDLHTFDSPFLLIVDIDGVQLAVLSAVPNGRAYRERWRFREDVPLLHPDEDPPRVNFYGRGRGVAFHAERGLGDPRNTRTWSWPSLGRGRNFDEWRTSRRKLTDLFAFEPEEVYRVKVLRDRGRLTLFVDGREVDSKGKSAWARIGRTSDRDPHISNHGTGRLQIVTWTPMALDNVLIKGIVLDAYRPD